VSVRQGRGLLIEEDIVEEEISSSPSLIHRQASGLLGQAIWLTCSMVVRNVVIPFVFPCIGSDM
jgi:hypothetical protein